MSGVIENRIQRCPALPRPAGTPPAREAKACANSAAGVRFELSPDVDGAGVVNDRLEISVDARSDARYSRAVPGRRSASVSMIAWIMMRPQEIS